MRTHLLQLLTAVAAISVLLFASAAFRHSLLSSDAARRDHERRWSRRPPVSDPMAFPMSHRLAS